MYLFNHPLIYYTYSNFYNATSASVMCLLLACLMRRFVYVLCAQVCMSYVLGLVGRTFGWTVGRLDGQLVGWTVGRSTPARD